MTRSPLKLRAHWAEGKLLNWVKAWFSNKKQRVQINGKRSDQGCVTSGFPKGSVLSSLLFTIYINDLDTGIGRVVSKFADDVKIGSDVQYSECS